MYSDDLTRDNDLKLKIVTRIQIENKCYFRLCQDSKLEFNIEKYGHVIINYKYYIIL